jgi:FdrA protein
MIVKGLIKKGIYYDSVSLMIVTRELNKMEGIIDSSIVMGTHENKAILRAVGLDLPDFKTAGDADILIAIKATDEMVAETAVLSIDHLFADLRKNQGNSGEQKVRSLEDAVRFMPDANLSLISVAGRYAAAEAMKALQRRLHVMIFSDNVSIEEEKILKDYAHANGLLLMGPDCGTAMINGIPLGFANLVRRGSIGLVAASGTGLQEVSCVIANQGGGISHAIGTGGRDIKREIGAIIFLDALKALSQDEETKVIVLISKPPDQEVLKKIGAEIKNTKKPVVAILLGGDPEILTKAGAYTASTLEEAGLIAVALASGNSPESVIAVKKTRDNAILAQALALTKSSRGRYLRGLYSGGTLCDEAQLVLKPAIGFAYSNIPLDKKFSLDDLWKSKENTLLDMGGDEFTYGRPHPMIDFSLRNKRILQEAADPDVAIILLDVVLGFGSHPDPASELVPVILEAKKNAPELHIIGSVTGTDQDPQNRHQVIRKLEEAGMIILQSNCAAAELAGQMILKLSTQK